MEEIAKVIILRRPQPQERPMFVRATGRAVDRPKSRGYKELVSDTAKNYYKGELITEALDVEIKVYMEIPKSWSKNKKEQAVNGDIYPTHLSDLDNFAKSLMDGCSGVIWKDDGQVVDLKVSKRYSKVPRAEIRVYKIND